MFVGIVWNCAAELKLFLTAPLFLCTLATILQFLPSRFFLFPSDLRRCLSTPTSLTSNSSSSPPAAHHNINRDNISDDDVLKRAFNPYGSAAYNFILMSAYRGGPHTFAVVGLSSKPLHLYGKPTYQCHWLSRNTTTTSISTVGYKILPDWATAASTPSSSSTALSPPPPAPTELAASWWCRLHQFEVEVVNLSGQIEGRKQRYVLSLTNFEDELEDMGADISAMNYDSDDPTSLILVEDEVVQTSGRRRERDMTWI